MQLRRRGAMPVTNGNRLHMRPYLSHVTLFQTKGPPWIYLIVCSRACISRAQACSAVFCEVLWGLSQRSRSLPPQSQGASSKPRRHDTDAQPLGSPQGAMDGKMDLRCSDVHRRDPFPSLLTILPSNTRLPSDAASPACADFPGCTHPLRCPLQTGEPTTPSPASTEAAKALLRGALPNHPKFEGHFGAFSRSSRRLVCRPLSPWTNHFDED